MNKVLLDVALVAAVLVIGNVKFRHFEPRMPLWRRLLKVFAALAATATISYYFGTIGVIITFIVAALPQLHWL
jgi:hypothetical protein